MMLIASQVAATVLRGPGGGFSGVCYDRQSLVGHGVRRGYYCPLVQHYLSNGNRVIFTTIFAN